MRQSWRAQGLTVPQAAKVCGVSPAAIRKWIQRRHIARNEWGLLDAVELARHLAKRGTIDQRKVARRVESCARSS